MVYAQSSVDRHIPVFATLCTCVLLHHSSRKLIAFIFKVDGCMSWGLHADPDLAAALNS